MAPISGGWVQELLLLSVFSAASRSSRIVPIDVIDGPKSDAVEDSRKGRKGREGKTTQEFKAFMREQKKQAVISLSALRCLLFGIRLEKEKKGRETQREQTVPCSPCPLLPPVLILQELMARTAA